MVQPATDNTLARDKPVGSSTVAYTFKSGVALAVSSKSIIKIPLIEAGRG
jgi:hypothetical protein